MSEPEGMEDRRTRDSKTMEQASYELTEIEAVSMGPTQGVVPVLVLCEHYAPP